MPVLTVREVAEVCGGRVIGDPQARATSVSADSREVAPGQAFWAIRGGHAFVADARAAGATFAVVGDADAVPEGATAVVVEDTVVAAAAAARHVRARDGGTVIGITGSTGKTLTKDLTAAACGAGRSVHGSRGSFNNEIGVPLVILSRPEDRDLLVVELGARHVGEIGELCRIVQPDVGIVTGIGVTHLEEFGSRDRIARTKAELPGSLPEGGTAILPAADDYLDLLSDVTAAPVVTVGPGGQVRWGGVRVQDDGTTRFTLHVDGAAHSVALPLPGRHLVRNASFAVAAARAVGVDPAAAAAALAQVQPSSWRMEVTRADGRLIVNDAYNANPTSVAAALRTVKEMAGDRESWAVLGVMAELGDAADHEHERMGRLARALGFHRVVAVGDDASSLADAVGDADRVADADAAAELVGAEAAPDAVVLVKASRVAGLERTAERLTGEAG